MDPRDELLVVEGPCVGVSVVPPRRGAARRAVWADPAHASYAVRMKITVAVARIYGTDDQYGEERQTRPPGAPIVFDEYPQEGESVVVDFGPISDDIAEANRVRGAFGRAMLDAAFGGVGQGLTPQERLDQTLEEMGDEPVFAEHAWYVTFVLRRPVEVPDTEVAETDALFVESAFKIADQASEYAKPHLDLASTLVSTIVDSRALSTLVLDDRVLLFAEGKRPSGVPLFSGSGAVSVVRGGDSLARLGDRLSVLAGIDLRKLGGEDWLTRVSHWRTQALLETDPWKQFLWSFFAIEILINKLFDMFRDSVTARLRLERHDGGVVPEELPLTELVWEASRMPLRSKFALVASELFPESASEDVEQFRIVNEARGTRGHSEPAREVHRRNGEERDLRCPRIHVVGGACTTLILHPKAGLSVL
jgi:hypothetical protein